MRGWSKMMTLGNGESGTPMRAGYQRERQERKARSSAQKRAAACSPFVIRCSRRRAPHLGSSLSLGHGPRNLGSTGVERRDRAGGEVAFGGWHPDRGG